MPPRNRYADLLRVVAIGGVVYGHWLLVSITDSHRQLSGVDALNYVSWAPWATWLFQVMPLFFLVGGCVNAQSWRAHRAAGETWTRWVRDRALRLLWPTAVFLVAGMLAVVAAAAAGVPSADLADAAWLVALQLWFLPVYLLLIALTPALHAAHRRCGLVVPVVMVLGAAGVDACLLGARLSAVGYANYLLVWGTMHQWGFAWQDGTLTRQRWRPYALAAGGIVILAGLLAWGPFPVNMVGTTDGGVNNTIPPSVALLAFAAVQAGLLLAAEPVMSRLLARARLWQLVTWLNNRVLTVYLWHMIPVVVAAVALYPSGILAQPAIGSAAWWALRPAWIASLAIILAPAAIWLARFEQPLARRPASPPRSPAALAFVLVAAGVAAAGVALARITIYGFAPAGRVPAGTVAGYACGVILTLLAGRLAGAGRAGRAESAQAGQAVVERPA